ncbi:hypothetical protein HOD75_01310 [archaeon]|jgi:mRNA-degrading endonuclease RelE of RelBE toxin-antitoxin system|nr:hypothetical protein [archaeon]MBT4241516.1 hypothetical protein [archaeon]MBT4417613.1 hypothetical protein [archaeon]
MKYAVYMTDNFRKEMNKISSVEQKKIQNIFIQLKENPYAGNQLQIKILREKRLEEKRIYYLVFEHLNSVLMVAMSNKRTQQKTINYILGSLEDYRIYLEKILSKD